MHCNHLHSLRYNESINTTPANVYDNIHARVRNDKLLHTRTQCISTVAEKGSQHTLFFPIFGFLFSRAIIMKNELKLKFILKLLSVYHIKWIMRFVHVYLFIALHAVFSRKLEAKVFVLFVCGIVKYLCDIIAWHFIAMVIFIYCWFKFIILIKIQMALFRYLRLCIPRGKKSFHGNEPNQ